MYQISLFYLYMYAYFIMYSIIIYFFIINYRIFLWLCLCPIFDFIFTRNNFLNKISCRGGYGPAGEHWLTCQGEGVWSPASVLTCTQSELLCLLLYFFLTNINVLYCINIVFVSIFILYLLSYLFSTNRV